MDQKQKEFITNYLARHGAAAAGAIEPLMHMQEMLAFKGAEARFKTEMASVVPIVDNQGRRIGYRTATGAEHYTPKHVLEMEGMGTHPDAALKKLTTNLSPYGLQPDDLDNVDPSSLEFVDSEGNKVKTHTKATRSWYERHISRIRKPRQKLTEEQRLDEAKTVKGQVGSTGASFEMPVKKWKEVTQAHRNIKARGESDSSSSEGEGQELDTQTAQAILEEAGGDPNKARQIARQRGYSF